MADDLSSATRAPKGIDLIAGKLGAGFVRGQQTPQSATNTASFTTPGVEVAGHSDIRLDSVVSAISGSGAQAVVTIQTSFDNGATDAWRTVGSALTAQSAAGTLRAALGTLDRWVRASVAISGTTPSVTMSLSGEAI